MTHYEQLTRLLHLDGFKEALNENKDKKEEQKERKENEPSRNN